MSQFFLAQQTLLHVLPGRVSFLQEAESLQDKQGAKCLLHTSFFLWRSCACQEKRGHEKRLTW